MAVVPLPLPPNIAARALLYHLLEHGDIVGRDPAGHLQKPGQDGPDLIHSAR